MEYKRSVIDDRYFTLEIFECPAAVMLWAAQLSSGQVTIENFTHYGWNQVGFRFEIQAKNLSVTPALQRFDLVFTITKDEFLQLTDLWDQQGCYAVFHTAPSLKLKASDLPESQRYRVLDNFGWMLEMVIPGPASDGWGRFASPDRQLIDSIEEQLKNMDRS